jgi:hypothetical protein
LQHEYIWHVWRKRKMTSQGHVVAFLDSQFFRNTTRMVLIVLSEMTENLQFWKSLDCGKWASQLSSDFFFGKASCFKICFWYGCSQTKLTNSFPLCAHPVQSPFAALH